MDVTARLTRAEERVAAFDLKRVIESPLTTIAIAVALAIFAFVEVSSRWNVSLLTLLAALLATAPQALRRSQPWLAVALTLLGATGLLMAGVTRLPVAVGLSGVLSFYTILRLLSRRAAWILTASVGALLSAGFATVLRPYRDFQDGSITRPYWDFQGGIITMIAILGMVVATALLADVRRSRTEIKEVRADNLETLREQAAMAERARIAREMHDIVAHSVSMIAVQAETAPYTLEGLDDRTKQEFAEIAASARTTLTEMRRLLGVLRADVTTAPETAPQPGLALLPELLERHEGVVDLDVVGDAEPVPQAVDVSAYRIVQEALTNARVHAPGARVSIELTYRPAMLVLRIADDGPGPSGSTSDGHGLVGMRERAVALGGWFNAGPGPAGGFLIQAGLPLE
ncbi:Signal transduction histidine kinase [Streptosporangium subroseum]|uniref:histidine kinase n=1 Tax=Streptosporangium subroseum TaxID=106412 RepID=A0A239NYN2_9ACTN|nr:sensor histidine kinase [Streptosporangium subroseum]SNT59987.1 Signal transduction histidine kinase [Streptosporangium subroseum]